MTEQERAAMRMPALIDMSNDELLDFFEDTVTSPYNTPTNREWYRRTRETILRRLTAPDAPGTVCISVDTAQVCADLIEVQRRFLGGRRHVPALERASEDLIAAAAAEGGPHGSGEGERWLM